MKKLKKKTNDVKGNFKLLFRKIAEQEETIDTLSKRIREYQKTIGSLIKNWIDRL